ncbi:hypothetical protein ABZ612_34610 [Streptomyces avermitilis]|uniref:hypothetical protein n=1 Tax=Streptomyces avermitilis TaxID=33903 RepID=UPI0033E5FB02
MLVRLIEGGQQARDQLESGRAKCLRPGESAVRAVRVALLSHLEALTWWEITMDRTELQAKIDELMRQYDNEEIDGATYAQAMMELTASAQE